MKKVLMLGVALIALSAAAPAMADQYSQTTTTATSTTTAAAPQNYEVNTRGTRDDSMLTGFYAGVYGGYDWTDADTPTTSSANVDGWDGGIFVGYKVDKWLDSVNHFGIGLNGAIEAFYGWSDADDTVGTIKVEKDNEWGVSFRPGFSFVDEYASKIGLSPYGILGYRNTEFKTSGAGGVGNARHDGFELGLGTELASYNGFGVRVEYSHTWYDQEDGIDPDSNDLRAGVAFHF